MSDIIEFRVKVGARDDERVCSISIPLPQDNDLSSVLATMEEALEFAGYDMSQHSLAIVEDTE